MPRFFLTLAVLVFPCATSVLAQHGQPAPPQTARQALLEMLKGDEQAITKHLTVQVQQTLSNARGKSGSLAAETIAGFRGMALRGASQETFDSGSLLLAETDPKTHERFEVHVDSDDLAGDEDTLQLSLHQLRDGQEVDSPAQFLSQIEVAMIKQENIWRLNAITISAKLPVGDPKLMENLTKSATGGGMGGGRIAVSRSDQPEVPKADAEQTVRLLAMAQGMYAAMHPEIGFTCSLTDLLNQSGSMFQGFGIDPAVATGLFNGYKYALSGCQSSPAGSFQLIAEPVAPLSGAKAFCTDATHNLRVADDGRASTCLSSGRFASRSTGVTATHVELRSK
jgi:hypothetical protein